MKIFVQVDRSRVEWGKLRVLAKIYLFEVFLGYNSFDWIFRRLDVWGFCNKIHGLKHKDIFLKIFKDETFFGLQNPQITLSTFRYADIKMIQKSFSHPPQHFH